MIKAIFEYDESLVCGKCGSLDVHYNLYVSQGEHYIESDPDAPVWCNRCESETDLIEPSDFAGGNS